MTGIKAAAAKDPFWKPLAEAFDGPDPFSVDFYLKGGKVLKDVAVRDPEDGVISGNSCTEELWSYAIRMSEVAAYRIEFS
jgi:hypothetical protein